MANYERIAELLQNEAFVEEANKCTTMEDFQTLFVNNGAETTLEETVDLISQIAEKRKKIDEGELGEENLEEVAGGFVVTGTLAVVACVGIGVVAIGTAAGAAYTGYQALRWANKHKCK